MYTRVLSSLNHHLPPSSHVGSSVVVTVLCTQHVPAVLVWYRSPSGFFVSPVLFVARLGLRSAGRYDDVDFFDGRRFATPEALVEGLQTIRHGKIVFFSVFVSFRLEDLSLSSLNTFQQMGAVVVTFWLSTLLCEVKHWP